MKDKKKIVLVILGVLLVLALALLVFTGDKVKQTNTTLTHEAGQELKLSATDYFNVNDEKAAEFTFDTSKVDVNTVGEYEVTASYKGENFVIKINVVDTTAPIVEFSQRYLFTNDVSKVDVATILETVYDASEYTTKLVSYEKHGELGVMDEKALKGLTDTIPLPADKAELEKVGTKDVPTEPAIYRSVVEIADAHGNTALEEIYVIYDTTGALIEDTEDMVVEVAEADLDKEPTVDKSVYVIKDNVDGTVSADNITCALELRDADKHEWIVHVSYTDRAGNVSTADFLITVKAKTEETPEEDNDGGSDTEPEKDKDDSDKKPEQDDKDDTDKKPDNNDDSDKKPEQEEKEPEKEEEESEKEPEKEEDDAENDISPYEQKVINAGYGKVVKLDSNAYAVLMKNSSHKIGGKKGSRILYDYLEKKGLEPQTVTGGWIDSTKGWYWYIAKNIRKIDTSGDEW